LPDSAYIAGCDGAYSTVREALGIGFPGGTYHHLFYVADVDARGAVMNRELHGARDTADFLLTAAASMRMTRHVAKAAKGRSNTRAAALFGVLLMRRIFASGGSVCQDVSKAGSSADFLIRKIAGESVLSCARAARATRIVPPLDVRE
jgi:hypothetical protein